MTFQYKCTRNVRYICLQIRDRGSVWDLVSDDDALVSDVGPDGYRLYLTRKWMDIPE